jgi:hypothetical protein
MFSYYCVNINVLKIDLLLIKIQFFVEWLLLTIDYGFLVSVSCVEYVHGSQGFKGWPLGSYQGHVAHTKHGFCADSRRKGLVKQE